MKIYNASDFNLVLSEYDSIMEFAKESIKHPGDKQVCEAFIKGLTQKIKDTGVYYNLPLYRVLISNISMYITKIDENTLNSSDDVVQDTLFDRVDSLNSLTSTDPNMTSSEKKHQLRNSIAHGNIETETDGTGKKTEDGRHNLGKLYILVDNGLISGKIPAKDFEEIGRNIKRIDNYLKRGYDYTYIYALVNRQAKSFDEWVGYLKKCTIQRRKDNSLLPFEKMRYKVKKANEYRASEDTLFRTPESNRKTREKYDTALHISIGTFKGEYKSFDYKEEELSDEKKRFLVRYLKYITRGSINLLYEKPYELNEVLEDLNSADTDSTLDSSYVPEATIIDFLNTVIEYNNIAAKALSEGREVSFDEQKGILDRLKKYSYEGPYLYTANLLGKSSYLISFIQELSKGNHFDYNNFSSLNGINATLVSHVYNPGNTSTTPDNSMVLSEPAAVGARQNSSNFFRHFRNAIAHGNYKIEYGDYGDIDSYVIKFNDIKRDRGKHEKKLKEYKFELTVKQLIDILKEFQDRVNNNLRTNNIENQFGKKLLDDAIRDAKAGGQDVIDTIVRNIKKDDGEEIV